MEETQLILIVFLFAILFLIIRIKALGRWLRLNIEMKKGAGSRYPTSGYSPELSTEQGRKMKLKEHKIALRRAKMSGNIKKK